MCVLENVKIMSLREVAAVLLIPLSRRRFRGRRRSALAKLVVAVQFDYRRRFRSCTDILLRRGGGRRRPSKGLVSSAGRPQRSRVHGPFSHFDRVPSGGGRFPRCLRTTSIMECKNGSTKSMSTSSSPSLTTSSSTSTGRFGWSEVRVMKNNNADLLASSR